jgi:hypothetical protein
MYVEQHVTVGYTEMLSVAQQSFCGRFISPAKIGRCFCPILTRFGVFGRIFMEVPNIKFHCSHLVGLALMLADRQMDGHDEVNRCFSPLYEGA